MKYAWNVFRWVNKPKLSLSHVFGWFTPFSNHLSFSKIQHALEIMSLCLRVIYDAVQAHFHPSAQESSRDMARLQDCTPFLIGLYLGQTCTPYPWDGYRWVPLSFRDQTTAKGNNSRPKNILELVIIKFFNIRIQRLVEYVVRFRQGRIQDFQIEGRNRICGRSAHPEAQRAKFLTAGGDIMFPTAVPDPQYILPIRL